MKKLEQQQLSTPSTQSGFTLIECLLAIIIVALLLAAVAPAIVLSAATRLQARRVDMATQAARAYVDGLRAGSIPAPPFVPTAPNQANVIFLDKKKTNPASQKNLFDDVPVPTGSDSWTCTPTQPVQNPTASPPDPAPVYCGDANGQVLLYCVSFDGNPCSSKGPGSKKNFVVQAIRSVAYNATNTPPYDNDDLNKGTKGYLLGIRVYRADALDGSGLLRTSVVTDASKNPQGRAKRQLAYTAGVGDRKAPVVELTTEVKGDQTNWKSLCDRLGGCTTPSPSLSP